MEEGDFMQYPPGDGPVLPGTAQPAQASKAPCPDEPRGRARPRRGRLLRFMRGYLMLVGGMTTLYVLVRVLVILFVEMGRWT